MNPTVPQMRTRGYSMTGFPARWASRAAEKYNPSWSGNMATMDKPYPAMRMRVSVQLVGPSRMPSMRAVLE